MAARKHKIIDAHSHPDWLGMDLEKWVSNMNKNRIARSWLLSWESPLDEVMQSYTLSSTPSCICRDDGPIPFQRCLAYVERCPDRFVLGYAPDPRRPGAVERMKAAIDIYGVRVCGEFKLRMMYDNPDALELFRFCGEQGLPVVLHLQYPVRIMEDAQRSAYWYGGGIDTLERVLRECPQTTIIGHAMGFWVHISGDNEFKRTHYPSGKVKSGGRISRLLEKYPNLYCDMSAGSGLGALKRDPAFARRFLVDFADRMLFARDCSDDSLYRFLVSLKLPRTVLDRILFRNAEKLVPIKKQNRGDSK